LTNNSLPLFKPSIFTIGFKSKVLEKYSSFYIFLKKSFYRADKFSFGEGTSLNKPPLFYGKNYQLWDIRIKFFIESLDKEIWNVISNNVLMHIPEI